MDPAALLAWITRTVGGTEFRHVNMAGGASDRWYVRVRGPSIKRFTGAESAVIMGVSRRLRHAVAHFSSIRAFLEAEGIAVPACYAESSIEPLMLLEDLGDTTLTEANERDHGRVGLHDAAIHLLANLHDVPADSERCRAMSLHFDRAKYGFEFSFHVWRWLLNSYLGAIPTPGERERLDDTFRWISEYLASLLRVFTHRDFQSRNLMVRDDGSLAIVDFQDARRGARAYDLASFLYDSYIERSDEERRRLESAYHSRIPAGERPSGDEFHRQVIVAALQRKLHDVGAFIYTAHARGKSEYLRWIPGTLDMIASLAADIPEARECGAILTDLRGRSERAP